jgi:hypothetical protein
LVDIALKPYAEDSWKFRKHIFVQNSYSASYQNSYSASYQNRFDGSGMNL